MKWNCSFNYLAKIGNSLKIFFKVPQCQSLTFSALLTSKRDKNLQSTSKHLFQILSEIIKQYV